MTELEQRVSALEARLEELADELATAEGFVRMALAAPTAAPWTPPKGHFDLYQRRATSFKVRGLTKNAEIAKSWKSIEAGVFGKGLDEVVTLADTRYVYVLLNRETGVATLEFEAAIPAATDEVMVFPLWKVPWLAAGAIDWKNVEWLRDSLKWQAGA